MTSTSRRGRPRRVQRDAGDSRRELLDAAQAEFAEHGFAKATLAGIVARAGLSKGTLYWNFESKEDLIDQLLRDRLDAPATALMAMLDQPTGDLRVGSTISRALAEQFSRGPELMRLLHEYWSAAVREPRLAERYRERHVRVRTEVAAALRATMPTAATARIDADNLAEAFIALAIGLGMSALIDPNDVRSDLFGDIASLVYDALSADGGSDRSN